MADTIGLTPDRGVAPTSDQWQSYSRIEDYGMKERIRSEITFGLPTEENPNVGLLVGCLHFAITSGCRLHSANFGPFWYAVPPVRVPGTRSIR